MLWLVSCAENRAVPHVDPVVTSRGDATGKGKYVLVRADKVVQSDSASWPNEMPLSLFSLLHYDPGVQGGSGGTFLVDRKGEEQRAQTEAGTKRMGDSKSDCVPEVPRSTSYMTGFLSGLARS